MDRGAWQAIVHGVAKESNMTKQQNKLFEKQQKKIHAHTHIPLPSATPPTHIPLVLSNVEIRGFAPDA